MQALAPRSGENQHFAVGFMYVF